MKSFQVSDTNSKEYFCYKCGQLRLAVDHYPNRCKNCGSTNILVGDVDSLDKDKLKAQFEESK